MKIKKLKVRNFRSLKEIEIEFNEDITCIVGENDSGKSSILDCIRTFSNSETYEIDVDDFYKSDEEEAEEIILKLELSNGVEIERIYNKQNLPNPSIITYYEKEYLNEELEKLKNFANEQSIIERQVRDISSEEYEDFSQSLLLLAKNLGLNPRSNSRINSILENIKNKIQEGTEEKVKVEKDFTISVYYLDGNNIDDIEKSIEKLFLSDIKNKIWQEKISIDNNEKSIKEILDNMILEALRKKQESLSSSSLIEKLKNYLNKKDIKIILDKDLTKPSLNVSFKVLIQDEQGRAINTQKKGDGTKRRITMALLEEKFREEYSEDEIKIFIFDEPDTHLHVKAQRDLLKLFKNYGGDKQIIITTHSPFIINYLKPSQIRFIYPENNQSKIKQVYSESYEIDKILKEELAIENILLFFARKILIVEGQSEVNFFENLYLKKYENTPYGDFIKIISANSISNVPQAVELITEVMNFSLENIYILADNDVRSNENRKMYKKIENFKEKGMPESNIFYIGNKEFEDSFSCEDLYNILSNILNKESCSIEDIQDLKSNSEKFSKDFCNKYQIDKTEEFPKALAEYFSMEENFEKLPREIKDILTRLREE